MQWQLHVWHAKQYASQAMQCTDPGQRTALTQSTDLDSLALVAFGCHSLMIASQKLNGQLAAAMIIAEEKLPIRR